LIFVSRIINVPPIVVTLVCVSSLICEFLNKPWQSYFFSFLTAAWLTVPATLPATAK
jgi:hypothetical protein